MCCLLKICVDEILGVLSTEDKGVNEIQVVLFYEDKSVNEILHCKNSGVKINTGWC